MSHRIAVTSGEPAGIGPDLCIQAVQSAIEHVCPAAAKIMIIPESHTRNLFYLESVATLQEIISKAGFEVRIGSLQPDLEQNQ